jgi:hypothetical protein
MIDHCSFALVASLCSPLNNGLHHHFRSFALLAPHVKTVTLEVIASEDMIVLDGSNLYAVVEFVEIFSVVKKHVFCGIDDCHIVLLSQ